MKTKAFPPKYNSFAEVLSSFTHNDPDRPVLIYEEDGKPAGKSRADFAASVFARAEEMRAFGMTCLGVLCDGSLDCVETIFASAVAGLQTVLLDENADDTLLQEQIRQTDIDILWSSDPDLVEELTPYLTDGITPQAESSDSSVEGSDILFFTSGTTASSKAVVLTDRSLLAAAYNGSVCGLLWGMECGAAVALGRGARYYTHDFEFYRPTVLSAVPLLLSFLVQHKLMNSELRLVLVGAGDCSPQLLNSVIQQGVQVSFGYGLTETSSGVAISVPGSSSFDPFALQICPEDTVALASDGEILISSPSCMMKGYYRHPEDTAAVLKGNLLFTGDLGKWDDDGRLHVIGRKKEILVLADGTKIFLPEYEARIMAKPVLLLVDKESSTWPEEMRELSRSMVQEELRGAMSQLPRGQQLSEILFTDLPLPRTATGKVKRWEIHCP